MTYDATILAESSITAYYKLNETSGTAANDSTANAFNGTLNGTITLNQAAIAAGLDPCMLFDGSTGYILLPTGVNLAPPFSIELWIKDNSITANGFFFSNNTLAGVGVGWDVTNSNKIFVYGHSGSYDTANALVSGNTYYLCLTVDTSNNYVIFAGRVGTDTAPTQWGTDNPGGAPTYSGGSNIGRRSDTTAKFKGYISSVAVYSAVLTSAQKNSHYTAGITAAGATLAGTLPGVGTLAGALSLTTSLTDTLAAVGTLSGTLSASLALPTETLAGVGTLSGAITETTALADTFAGSGTLSATVALKTSLAVSQIGIGTLSGTLSTGNTVALTTSLTGTGTLTPTPTLATALSTTVSGSGILAGTFSAQTALSTSMAGTGILASTFFLTTTLTSTLSGAGTLNGVFAIQIALFLTSIGIGRLSGMLSTGVMLGSYITVESARGTMSTQGARGMLTTVGSRGTITVEEA